VSGQSSLSLADSIGIDFHKPGFGPYIPSLILVQHKEDLDFLQRPQDQMLYLYQFGEQRPGMYTLETSWPGLGVLAALANLKLFGKEGLSLILGHVVELAQLLREHIESHECTTVLNRDNFGTVPLSRVYSEGVDTFQIKEKEMHDSSFRDVL